MRTRQAICILTVSILVAALVVGACQGATVTADVVAQKATSEDSKLEAKMLRSKGDQAGVWVQNTTLAPRDLSVAFVGLKDQPYDLYVNNSFKGSKTAKELSDGIRLTVNGTIADPDMMRCLRAVQPRVDAEYLRLSKIRESDPQRAAATLMQAVDWTRSGTKAEKTFRSVAVIVAPAGRMLESMGRPTWLSDIETARTITNACWLLQKARSRMASAMRDPDLRDSVVGAMTPVDLSTTWSVRNGKPHVDVTLLNNCNLPVTGKIVPSMPSGWKWNAKNAAFTNLRSGKTFKLSFDLLPKAKKAAIPDGLKLAAQIRLVQEGFEAAYNIKTVARKVSIAPVSKPVDTKPPVLVPQPPGEIQPKVIRQGK